MDPVVLVVLAVALGLALLVLEFFVPSGGMIGLMAAICLICSLWLGWKEWGTTHPAGFWSFFSVVLLSVPAVIWATLYILPRTEAGRHILLEAPTADEVTTFRNVEEKLGRLVGLRGETLSLLNPGGMVRVDGERHHCESPGMVIEPQTLIEVIGIKGNRLVVVECQPNAVDSSVVEGPVVSADETISAADNSELPGQTPEVRRATTDGIVPLDFEIPPG